MDEQELKGHKYVERRYYVKCTLNVKTNILSCRMALQCLMKKQMIYCHHNILRNINFPKIWSRTFHMYLKKDHLETMYLLTQKSFSSLLTNFLHTFYSHVIWHPLLAPVILNHDYESTFSEYMVSKDVFVMVTKINIYSSPKVFVFINWCVCYK